MSLGSWIICSKCLPRQACSGKTLTATTGSTHHRVESTWCFFHLLDAFRSVVSLLSLLFARHLSPWLNHHQPRTLLPSPTLAPSDWLTKSISALFQQKPTFLNAALHAIDGSTCGTSGWDARYLDFCLCQHFINPGVEISLGFISLSLEGVWLLIMGFL